MSGLVPGPALAPFENTLNPTRKAGFRAFSAEADCPSLPTDRFIRRASFSSFRERNAGVDEEAAIWGAPDWGPPGGGLAVLGIPLSLSGGRFLEIGETNKKNERKKI